MSDPGGAERDRRADLPTRNGLAGVRRDTLWMEANYRVEVGSAELGVARGSPAILIEVSVDDQDVGTASCCHRGAVDL